MREFVIILLLLSSFATGVANVACAADSGPTAAYLVACNHYENRARFKPRSNSIEFVTMLAEACRTAQASLAAPDGRQHAAALRFLDRLVELRDVVVTLSLERAYGPDPHPYKRLPTRGERFTQLPAVTATGEFLIAHRMGLVSALDELLDSDARIDIFGGGAAKPIHSSR